MTACQLVWEAPWQKRLIPRLRARASRDAPSEGGNLARFDLSICVVEAANDIALGASKANGGLVHAGYDPSPGTVKAQVNARGCELYGTWAQELGFLFRRTRLDGKGL